MQTNYRNINNLILQIGFLPLKQKYDQINILGIGSRINHKEFGLDAVTNVTSKYCWVTFIKDGLETINIDSDFEIIEDEVDSIIFYEVEQSLKKNLQKWSDVTEISPIADKWKKGTLILRSVDSNLADKEIPIDTFFHKIVIVRDRIRVKEQKINAIKTLDDQNKIDLQQYITRIYGSLTTFTALFKLKVDHFLGENRNKNIFLCILLS